MKNKLRCLFIALTLPAGVAVILISPSAQAQNLFESDFYGGKIYEFTTNGTKSTFAPGLSQPTGLAFNFAGILFALDAGSGNIYEFTTNGTQSAFASGLNSPQGLAFDSKGNLFVADAGSGNIFEFTNGIAVEKSIFASGLHFPFALAFNSAGNLFVADGGTIYEYTPLGAQSTLTSVLNQPIGLAFDSVGDLFVADTVNNGPGEGKIYEFTNNAGALSPNYVTFVSGLDYPDGLAFDSVGNLFESDGNSGKIFKFTTNGTQSTFASSLNHPSGLAFNYIRSRNATGTVTLGNLSQIYNGTAESVSVTTAPPGLSVNVIYNGSPIAPTNTGIYTVIGTINDPIYQGSATNSLVIGKATGTVTLGNLVQTYIGTVESVSVTTAPPGLSVNVTYNGSPIAPTNAGSYTVIGTLNNTNYFASSTTNTLIVFTSLPPPPQLTITPSGENIILMWSANPPGFNLQSATSLVSPTVWSTNLPSPTVVNGQNSVTNPIIGTQNFYSLSFSLAEPLYTIAVSASPSAGGTVSGGGAFFDGTTQAVTATANSGYLFTNWTEVFGKVEGVVSTSPSYNFTLNANVTFVANFTQGDIISVSASPGAGGTVSGGGTFANGSSQTVIATANSGYQFLDWTANGTVVSTSPSFTFTLVANTTLVANFTQGYIISVSASPSGDGTVSGGGVFASGSSVTVMSRANSGYVFVNWTENGTVVSTTTSYTFTLTTNRTLVANYAPNPSDPTITLISNATGGPVLTGAGTFPSGSYQTINVIPTPGYTFENWTDNGTVVSTSPSYSFYVTTNVTLEANFLKYILN